MPSLNVSTSKEIIMENMYFVASVPSGISPIGNTEGGVMHVLEWGVTKDFHQAFCFWYDSREGWVVCNICREFF